MYRTSLPSHCEQPAKNDRERQFWAAVALSALLHALLIWALNQREEKYRELTAEKPEKGIEVMLTTAPKPKTESRALKTEPAKPKPPSPIKPLAKPAPRPAPPVAQTLPPPLPKPAPPKPQPAPIRPPPMPRPRRREPQPPEPLPEFKDDFAALSKDYSSTDNSQPQTGAVAAQADTGIHPGAILNINPRIYYPRQAMQRGMQGVVVVLIHIGVDGHTESVDLLQSSGFEELDNVVLGAVQHWLFRPPMRGNTPVEGAFKHTVIFGADEEVIDDFRTHWQEIRLMPSGG